MAREANFDGLIGPTHNYAGLSDGNLASSQNAGKVSYPRAAALQGLQKMKYLHDAGMWQGVLPPQQRPFFPALRALGFSGSDKVIYENVWKQAPRLAKNMLSASSMWAANAATISPSIDCGDGYLHITPANLLTMLHRSVEHEQTARALKNAFPFAIVHEALPMQALFSDEGAANHVRLCGSRGDQGVELFVYGRDGFGLNKTNYPARQTLQAAKAVTRRHHLREERTVFARQSERAINAGAFHNDVVCVGTLDTLFYHEHAFAETQQMQADITKAAEGLFDPKFIEVPADEVPLADAISSYLFNSMLVKIPQTDGLTLISPLETQESQTARQYCERLISGNGPISNVTYLDVRQSMQNGGGPACLRLRVCLKTEEWAKVRPGHILTDSLFVTLTDWVHKHYRESLSPQDLPDPLFIQENLNALDELTQIMSLGSDFYPFQR